MNKTKIIVAGSRNFNDKEFVYSKLDYYLQDYINVEIVEGGARGVDSLARQYAIDHKIVYHEFPAHWDAYGKAAGGIRNNKMAEFGDVLIAFYNGSKGTANMINAARRKNLKIVIVSIEENQYE